MVAKRGKQAVRNGGYPAWAWVLIGLIIGAIGMAAVTRAGWIPMTRQHQGPQANPQARPEQATDAGAADQGVADSASKKPDYSFYSVLPEKEVVIPDAQISAQAKAESQTSTQPSTAAAPTAPVSHGYLLQVGSFPSAGDAEAMKAKLALQGFVANIQPVTIDSQTWNRVRLGPYQSASALEADKQKLSAAGIHAIALKETQ